MTSTRTISAITLALLLCGGVASAQTIDSSAATTANTTGSTMTHVNIAIEGTTYNPHNVVVSAGSTVVWTNGDSVAHSIVADRGAFSSGAIPAGGTYSQLFTDPGTYLYYDPAHGAAGGQGMFGVIVVLPKNSSTSSGTVTGGVSNTTTGSSGTTSSNPGVPNTGEGGNAAATALVLALSAGMIGLGARKLHKLV
jgi:LPXTG-motif cell wall-anchored protein